ncbi:hypothetical protein [Silvanigrella aquatica]|uniref:Uncharacterized protein n=1 Tax=Silvanigrella aquatica TaxID=1915309 RepID=A0A1L4D407_9BACT|nr:hypothetical protein [Silvanigrella aquatica]APJ04907.1 hypothetical protein AXG55_13795 [Silvanigrella aquatica]
MNLKNVILSLSIIVFIGLISLKVQASEKLTKISEETNSKQFNEKDVAKNFSRGESFIQGGVTYTVYPELKAEFNKKNEKEVPSQGNKSNIVMSNKSFTIYNADGHGKKESPSKGNQIVLNENSESFGILSGIIIVKMKNNSLFNDSSFEIVKSYPKLGYYLIKIPNGFKIQDTLNKIQKNNNVEDTTVEVIENFKEPL